jgi:hypothetical protein
MGEIKSTLDLVLEKTRNLTLSREERLDLARQELDKRVNSLLTRYLDNLLPLSTLREEMEKIDTQEHGLAYQLLKKHLLAHFDLDGDNSLILSALSEIVNFNIDPLTVLQREYESEKEESRKLFSEKALSALEERGVSGSALVPNLDQDPEWNQFLEGFRKRYQESIRTIENGSQGSPEKAY